MSSATVTSFFLSSFAYCEMASNDEETGLNCLDTTKVTWWSIPFKFYFLDYLSSSKFN